MNKFYSLFPFCFLLNSTASAELPVEKCGTAQMLTEWQKKSVGDRSYWTVPVLTGTQLIYSTAHFEIYYTLSGSDSVSPLDANGNFVPDIVDTVATAAEFSYANYLSRGYVMPPDAAIGTPSLYDIFLLDIPTHYNVNWYGATLAFDSIGDNPATVEPEIHSATSFLVLRNEYTIFSPNTNPSTDIDVTVAHEFSHSIDFGYSLWISSWFTEARSTFEESNVYPQLTDNYQYLNQTLNNGDLALNLDRKDNGGVIHPHEYGGWLFNKYLAEHVAAEVLKPVLESARQKTDSWAATDADALNTTLIYDHETTLREEFTAFCVANYFLTSDSSYAPYTYVNGSSYRDSVTHGASLEHTFNYTGADVFWSSIADGNGILQRLGADYFRINATEKFSVRLIPEGANDTSFHLILLKIKTASKHFEFCPAGFQNDSTFCSNIIDLNGFDKIIAIVIRYDFYDTLPDSKQYILSVEEPLQFINWWVPRIPFDHATTTIGVDNTNVLWVNAGFSNVLHNGFQVGGVTRYNKLFWKHSHYYNSVRAPGTPSFPGAIFDIQFAANNHVWFADGNAGIYEYNRTNWKNYDDGDNNPGTTYHAYQLDVSQATVWSAPRDYFLHELAGGVPTQQGTYPAPTTFVKFMGGKKYIGTSGAGLFIENGGTTVYDTSNGLPSMYLNDAAIDLEGNLWVATNNAGVAKFDGSSWETFDPWHPAGGYVAGIVNKISIALDSAVWFANQNSGFSRYRNNSWLIYDNITAPLFPAYSVYDIDFDKDNGCLWLATDHGIVFFCDTAEVVLPVTVQNTQTELDELSIFPNPVNDVISLYANGKLFAEKSALKLFDIGGREVMSYVTNFSTNELKVNVSSLAAGLYLISINHGVKRFVKL